MRTCLDRIVIGMPQLGPYGLSENWILRHVGDLHWRVICDTLQTRSRDIVDKNGNRLYASFLRVTWTASKPLSAFGESDELTGSMEMVRCTDGIFISSTSLCILDNTISLRMASIFSLREHEGSNQRLLPSAPVSPEQWAIPCIDSVPPYLSQHRQLRPGRPMGVFEFDGENFHPDTPARETVPYRINGYSDFNGAKLLYFASYPTIADTCAAASNWIAESIGYQHFVTMCSPSARDIFYFGNADITDCLQCAIVPHAASRERLAYRIDMFRLSDGRPVSRQFVIRAVGAKSCGADR
jgi:probable biosynthetic protein (TIGR04098 family)